MITEILNTSGFVETKSTRKITTVLWPKGEQEVTYRSENCIVTQKEIQDAIDRKNSDSEKTMKAITVKMVDLYWIMEG